MTTLERIAAVMGCTPEDDDDLVEAVRFLVSERDAARAVTAGPRSMATARAGRRRALLSPPMPRTLRS